jgi:hypothetical protein
MVADLPEAESFVGDSEVSGGVVEIVVELFDGLAKFDVHLGKFGGDFGERSDWKLLLDFPRHGEDARQIIVGESNLSRSESQQTRSQRPRCQICS